MPDSLPYAHSEGNSPAHVKSSLVGASITIPIEDGQLVLGTWQGIFFCEFDGPRRRQVYVLRAAVSVPLRFPLPLTSGNGC